MATADVARPAPTVTAADRAEPLAAIAGPLEWLTTVDHKRIGILYLVTALAFFVVGGVLALIMRLQLALPESAPLSPAAYNQTFTIHASIMLFLYVIPVLTGGFGNYLVPLMIGAREIAFPKLNALSYWLFPIAALVVLSGFLVGGAADTGWTAYPPLSVRATYGQTLWGVGVLLIGVSSILGAINFLVTILNMRAPGMTLHRMPLFCWAMLATAFIQLMGTPALLGAVLMLLMDRELGTAFFDATRGGNVVGYQHAFWFYSHPALYVMILPAFGIISEILPVFSRKPIFGYKAIAYSSLAIALLGFTVWVHHMYTVGLPLVAQGLFMMTTMSIAVPTGLKVFNWIATLWGGYLDFKAPLLFALGFLAMFVIGGSSGLATAVVPVDWQLHDTYWVVAHLHYMLFGGSTFAVFAGLYYWFPKLTGRLYSERLARVHFWTLLIGFNLTFLPLHILGVYGMQRRIATYPVETGFLPLNVIATAGAFLMAFAMLVFIWNAARSLRVGELVGADPWRANTLEWYAASPPPAYNFRSLPLVVRARPLRDHRLRAARDAAATTEPPAEAAVAAEPAGA